MPVVFIAPTTTDHDHHVSRTSQYHFLRLDLPVFLSLSLPFSLDLREIQSRQSINLSVPNNLTVDVNVDLAITATTTTSSKMISSSAIRRMYELRERSKARLHTEISRSVDELFDLIISETFPGQEIPPLSTLAREEIEDDGRISTAKVNGQVAHSAAPGSERKKKKEQQSKSLAANCSKGSSSTLAEAFAQLDTNSDHSLRVFNGESLRDIFNGKADAVRPVSIASPDLLTTSSPQSSSECDSQQQYSVDSDGLSDAASSYVLRKATDSSSDYLPTLLAEINSEVFSDDNTFGPFASLMSSLAGSDSPLLFATSPASSTTHSNGLLDSPSVWLKKSTSGGSGSSQSFAKIAAKAADSPTKSPGPSSNSNGYILPKRCHLLRSTTPKSGAGSTKKSNERDYNDYSHHFKTRYVNCYIGTCKKSFPMVPLLNSHLKDDHKVLRHRCPLQDCEESFNEMQEYTTHVHKVHSDVTDWTCHKCNEHQEHHRALIMHNYMFHQDGLFECKKPDCNVNAKNRGAIIHHCKTAHNQGSTDPESYFNLTNDKSKQAIASTSGTTVGGSSSSSSNGTSSGNYQLEGRPSRDNQFQTKWVCCVIQNCTKIRKDVDELNQHLKEEHQLSPIFCPIFGCPETFDKMPQMDLHILRDHANVSVWRCGRCAFIGRDHRQLSAHIYWCHCEGEFKCISCSKVAKFRNDITSHYATAH